MSTYKVVASGKAKPGITPEEAIRQLQDQLKLPEQAAAKLLEGSPVTVKKGIHQPVAEEYARRLENAGLVVTVRPMDGEADDRPKVPEASTQEVPAVSERERVVSASTEEMPAVEDGDRVVGTSAPTEEIEAVGADQTMTTEWQQAGDYRFRMEARPDYAHATVEIPAGQSLTVEAAAMATMDTNLKMKTRMGGGLKRFVSGESLFINEFTAEGGPGRIGISPSVPGDMAHVELKGETLYLQNSAFVASTPGVEVQTKWQGLKKGFFSGEGLFLIRVSGTGSVWFNTYGAMLEIDVDGEHVVDNGHIVAFTEGLDYDITKVAGYKSLFFSGEGLVCRFKGKGKVWIQTRKARAFVFWAQFYRPVKKSN
ncbi:MAG: TIGR00266 family protein [Xanthomonadales bacterium]|nr:TIGR00266 family protein [Xanthomonadales bacterium]